MGNTNISDSPIWVTRIVEEDSRLTIRLAVHCVQTFNTNYLWLLKSNLIGPDLELLCQDYDIVCFLETIKLDKCDLDFRSGSGSSGFYQCCSASFPRTFKENRLVFCSRISVVMVFV